MPASTDRATSGPRSLPRLLLDLFVVVLAHLLVFPLVSASYRLVVVIHDSIRFHLNEHVPVFSATDFRDMVGGLREPVYATISIGLFLIEFCVALLAFRMLARRPQNSVYHFFAAWRRSCVLALVVACWLAMASSTPGLLLALEMPAVIAPAVITVFGPAFLAWRARRPARLPRRRPSCPECGHTIRRQVEPRCSECGATFPTASRVYLRWAVRRLPWDRQPRSGWISAYLGTLAALACPARAATLIAIPDRIPRAVAWAAVNLFGLLPIAAFAAFFYYAIGSILGGEVRWDTPNATPGQWAQWRSYMSRRVYINLQTYICWGVAGIAILLPAIAIIAAHPRMRPHDRSTSLKWTLYSIAAAAWFALILGCAYAVVLDRRRFGFPQLGAVNLLHATALFFAWYWAIGFARMRYQPSPFRSIGTYAGLYLGLWCVLILWVFPLDELWQVLE